MIGPGHSLSGTTHKSKRYVHHSSQSTNFKNSHKYAEQEGKKVLLMQASDVTDRWLLIVQEICCVGPLKRSAAQGIIKQAWNWKGGNVLIALGDTDTAPSHRGTPREGGKPRRSHTQQQAFH